jgi:hypothetical protein
LANKIIKQSSKSFTLTKSVDKKERVIVNLFECNFFIVYIFDIFTKNIEKCILLQSRRTSRGRKLLNSITDKKKELL